MADFVRVEKVLDELDLKENFSGAEFGCGSADFALALAERLKVGRVYALDIQEEKLSAIKGKLSLGKINNVYTILCDLERERGSKLADNSLDIVLIPNLLFQVQDRDAIIREAKRVLKSGRQLLIIDWAKRTPFNAKESVVAPEEVKKIAESFALVLKKEFAVGDYHYGLLFIK